MAKNPNVNSDDCGSIYSCMVHWKPIILRKQTEVFNSEEPYVHTSMFPVGNWSPWDINANAAQDQELMVDELNELMAKKKANEEQNKIYFEKINK